MIFDGHRLVLELGPGQWEMWVDGPFYGSANGRRLLMLLEVSFGGKPVTAQPCDDPAWVLVYGMRFRDEHDKEPFWVTAKVRADALPAEVAVVAP